MNKKMIGLHWLITWGLLWGIAVSQNQFLGYNQENSAKMGVAAVILFLWLMGWFHLSGQESVFYHTCIGLIGMVAGLKLCQMPVLELWPVYGVGILYGIQIWILKYIWGQRWGIGVYTLLIQFLLPVLACGHILWQQPVLTTIFDNDLFSIYGLNVFFCASGYVVGDAFGNYLGMMPFIVFSGFTIALAIVGLAFFHIRKKGEKSSVKKKAS